ncbi:MAG: LysM peptidoglycan-binding domain-containing protein [Planctomycetota bacterium]
MTRDTRIGLLVGLLFILAFGLILGELTNPTPPEQPRATASPPPRENLASYPHAARVREDRVIVAPRRRRPQPVTPRRDERIARAPEGDREGVRENGILRAAGREGQISPPPQRDEIPAPQAVTYRVREGDSLSRIARTVYGPQNEHLYRRIFEANRDKLADESTLTIGQVLVIPPLQGTPARRATSSAPAVTEADDQPIFDDEPASPVWHTEELDLDELEARYGRADSASSRASSRAKSYVVRSGDTLTSIARQMMGDDSPQAVAKLYQANRSWIADADSLPVGMELMIP